MNKQFLIVGSIFLVLIALGFYLSAHDNSVNGTASTAPADPKLLIKANSHMTGSPTAKVQLVEFGDYQCPACDAAYPIVKQITDKYASNKDFNFVFRNFPLPQHQFAMIAAEAAEAAGEQGKYWQMHDLLYANQNNWISVTDPTVYFVQYASQLGLDVNKFKSEIQAGKFANIINADKNDAITLNITGTPGFFINGELSVGVPNFDYLDSQISKLLSK